MIIACSALGLFNIHSLFRFRRLKQVKQSFNTEQQKEDDADHANCIRY